MDNRTCVKCGKELRSDNRSGYCRKCRAYAQITAYSKQEGHARSKRNHAEFRLKIAVIKLERGCVDCGYSRYAEALDFDHLPGAEKVKSVALMWGYTWDKVLAEIAKCEVVCSNCHRHRTKVRAESAKAMAAQAAAGMPRATPLIRPAAACGTESGYKRHLRLRERPCAECRDAATLLRRRERRTARGADPDQPVAATSPYKGVGWSSQKRMWRARINPDGHERHLGFFLSEMEAAYAYDAAARETFGEFARTNFPEGPAQAMRDQRQAERTAYA